MSLEVQVLSRSHQLRTYNSNTGKPKLGIIARGRSLCETGEVAYENYPIDALPQLAVWPEAGLYLADVEAS